MSTELPPSVLDLVENRPVEDMLLHILREGLPDVPIYSLIPDAAPAHFVLVRRLAGFGNWKGDPRFVDVGRFQIECFTQDPDGDWKGAILSEAVRVVLRNAWLNHVNYPDLGSVVEIQLVNEPSRRPDFATSVGPIQYADLPNGWWRYEAVYTIQIRRPRS